MHFMRKKGMFTWDGGSLELKVSENSKFYTTFKSLTTTRVHTCSKQWGSGFYIHKTSTLITAFKLRATKVGKQIQNHFHSVAPLQGYGVTVVLGALPCILWDL